MPLCVCECVRVCVCVCVCVCNDSKNSPVFQYTGLWNVYRKHRVMSSKKRTWCLHCRHLLSLKSVTPWLNVKKKPAPVCCRWKKRPLHQACTRLWKTEVLPLKGSPIWASNRVSSSSLHWGRINAVNESWTYILCDLSLAVNLWMIYKTVEKLGGYDSVSGSFSECVH